MRPPAVSYRITDGADSLPSIYTATFEHIFVVKTTFRHIALIRFAMMCTLQRSSKYTVPCCVCAKCVSYKGGERDWWYINIQIRYIHSSAQPALVFTCGRKLRISTASRSFLLALSPALARTDTAENTLSAAAILSPECLSRTWSPHGLSRVRRRASPLCSRILVSKERSVSPTYVSRHHLHCNS